MAKALAVVAAVLLACGFFGVRGDEGADVRDSLILFLSTLAGGDGNQTARRLGWDAAVDPCRRGRKASLWGGTVTCFGSESENDGRIKIIDLRALGLTGTIDAALLCAGTAVRVVNLTGNTLRGRLPAGISGCSGLTHLYVGGNQLSGTLPPSFAQLASLLAVDVSRNNFSGAIPAGLGNGKLVRFLANDNHFDGTIPEFNLTGFDKFNVSNNNLTGPIPKLTGNFSNDSFWPNAAGMCGTPLFPSCPSSSSPPPSPQSLLRSPAPNPVPGSVTREGGAGEGESKEKRTIRRIVTYLGYALLGSVILAFVLYKVCSSKKRRSKLGRKARLGGGRSAYESSKPTTTTTTTSASASKSAYSMPTSVEQSVAAAGGTSLVVLRRSGTASITSAAAAAAAKELRFEDLLKSPAELLGRGRFGSSYKVVVPSGAALAVKRVKDAAVREEEFRRRMERVARAKHPAVLSPLAFYCAMQEKLVVYEFQSNGSLAKLLHGSIESSQEPLDWPARLHIAAKVADGMAFMHSALRGDGAGSNSSSSSSGEATADDGPIAHGNLKASNILFTAAMDPCISEYGLTAPAPPADAATTAGTAGGSAAFRADVVAFGVLMLELLTGKATSAQGDGVELARWVTSVIREEWTAEVFDRALLAGGYGASEQRMVQLLQVAMRCVDTSPSAVPPTMREVAGMVNAIREDDDRSVSTEA